MAQKMRKNIPNGMQGASFFVGSLLHEDPREYVAVCNAWTGEVKGHVNMNAAPDSEDVEQDFYPEPEPENINQLTLF